MSVFKFKQFEVAQDQCAQKIGTDAVLLGAWADPKEQPFSVLDVGTGTGVIALMMAQRFSSSQVDAIEIDDAAFEQATFNFENSPYGDRLFCYHASFQEFYQEVEERYALIISNPPFFDGNLERDDQIVDQKRQQARFDDALPFDELVYGVYQLLENDGTFACIIPSDREQAFLKITDHFQLVPVRKTYVKGTADAPVKRVLMEFRFRESEKTTSNLPTVISHLIIEKSRHYYTDDYVNLTKDFYLKM
ncbi:tRNA1(Val) (adenine(37)-N6)-methyltransferase [Nonlabens agnitus]|uniref:tRNA1(Val) (adenine(37)-N6)-methyltransferase n=1 Tax=Nonlabens agnitus TaxID=870484 RepID=A0A2S9WVJ9_9FLAO|nr:methyltransferase [Nonlabens agnitus]PRP67493.1 tRNA (adenine-N(6)-)-methyltransferase [Nonlabens agnitus]